MTTTTTDTIWARHGDQIAPKATKLLTKAGIVLSGPNVQVRSTTALGGYVCTHCGARPHNNISAAGHANGPHKLGWLWLDDDGEWNLEACV